MLLEHSATTANESLFDKSYKSNTVNCIYFSRHIRYIGVGGNRRKVLMLILHADKTPLEQMSEKRANLFDISRNLYKYLLINVSYKLTSYNLSALEIYSINQILISALKNERKMMDE